MDYFCRRMSNWVLFRGILGSFDLLLLICGKTIVACLCGVVTQLKSCEVLAFGDGFNAIVDGSMNLYDHSGHRYLQHYRRQQDAANVCIQRRERGDNYVIMCY